MTRRVLQRSEYGLLVGTDAEPLIALLSDSARVVVVEHNGQIVGCEAFQPILHAEGLWIHPDYRRRIIDRTSVARELWKGICETVRETFGLRGFVTGADSDHVRKLLAHLGAVKLPDHYSVMVEKS